MNLKPGIPVMFDSFLILLPAEYASGTAIEKNSILLKQAVTKIADPVS